MKIRLFIDSDLRGESCLILDKSQSHYLLKVLRLKVGDELFLFDGKNGEFRAELKEVEGKFAEVSITNQTQKFSKSSNVSLAFAPVKNAKAEWLAAKATELGVVSVKPVVTEFTIVRKVNEERMRANMIEAAEQCERLDVPEVSAIVSLKKFLDDLGGKEALVFCDESGGGMKVGEFSDKLEGYETVTVLVGPEGGFSDKEREMIRGKDNVFSMSLGRNILKADTAVIVALGLVV